MLYGELSQLVEDVIDMYNELRNWHSGSTTSFEGISCGAKRDTAEVKRVMREEKDRAESGITDYRAELGQDAD